jgi:hypothetical protein
LVNNSLIPTQTNLIKIDDDLIIDSRLTQTTINAAGVKMLKFKYWVVKTKDREYKITSPDEYKRIAKALNVTTIRFLKIDGDLVSVISIEAIKEKTGYKEIKEGGKHD